MYRTKPMTTTVKKVHLRAPPACPVKKTIMCTVGAIYGLTVRSRGEAERSIKRKIAGYRQQDVSKDRNAKDNAEFRDVVSKLVMAKGCCTYCDSLLVLSGGENRNKLQWSLDRIDNSLGHTANNTVISCLACNLRRRARSHTKFLAGSRMAFVKMY